MTTAVNVAHDRQRNKATHSKKQEHPESANLRRRKKIQPKAIRDSNPDFRINPHPNVCRICYKMLWMHYLVDVTHFAKYKKKVKQRIVLREIHLRTTGRHLSMGSHSVICHPTEVTLWYKYGTSRPLIARIMLTNVQTSTIPQWWRQWKSDPESTRWSGSPPNVNHFWRVTSCPCL